MDQIWIAKEAQAVLDTLEHGGIQAWIVGGCVRDMLRGVTPHDWDIAAAAAPEEIAAALHSFRLILTGIQHGTVTAISDGQPIEVTACRGEGEYLDARHPATVFFHRSIEEDLARRDFTMNALAYSPKRGLLDLYGGQADMEAEVIRCIRDPEDRFREDALRILRALRFSAVLGYEIEPKTAAAIHALRYQLEQISVERCTAELCKLLLGQDAPRILTEYADVLAVLLPEAAPMMGFWHRAEHGGDLWQHSAASLAAAPEVLEIRLALLLRDCAKPLEKRCGEDYPGHAAHGAAIAEQALRRLRLPSAAIRRVALLVRHHSVLPKPEDREILQALRIMGEDVLLELYDMREADRRAHGEDGTEIAFLRKKTRALLQSGCCYQLSQLAVSGEDLKALGFSGPQLGQTLQRLLSAVIDGICENRKESLLLLAGKLHG